MTIAELCPLPAFIVAYDGKTIVYVNAAYQRMTGRTLFDLNEGDWADLVIHPDDREKTRAAWASFLKDGQLQPHWHRYVHKDGTVFEGMTLVERVQGNGFVGFIVPQCGKQDCPIRNLNADLWKLWDFTKKFLHENQETSLATPPG
jgi:PAS domain S-box-containing protein